MIVFVFSEIISQAPKFCPAGTPSSPWSHATLARSLSCFFFVCDLNRFALVGVCSGGSQACQRRRDSSLSVEWQGHLGEVL